MIVILLAIHVLIILALVGVVLMQKSEGGALGIGGGGGMSGFMTGRSTANLLTRATAILAALFITTSVLLVVLGNQHRAARSILDSGAKTGPALPAVPSPARPAVPSPKLPAVPGPKLPPVPPANPAPPGPAAPSVPSPQ
jgi:preprotein translocase subunit SecG